MACCAGAAWFEPVERFAPSRSLFLGWGRRGLPTRGGEAEGRDTDRAKRSEDWNPHAEDAPGPGGAGAGQRGLSAGRAPAPAPPPSKCRDVITGIAATRFAPDDRRAKRQTDDAGEGEQTRPAAGATMPQ